jgi:hypothetical protein
MAEQDAASILAGIRHLIATPPEDKATRDELYQSMKELSDVIEDPHDTIYRIMYSVGYPRHKT